MNTALEIADKAREVPAEFAHINGWGTDLDHANRPAYPMERMPARLAGDHSHPPAKQAQAGEIRKSIEGPAMPRFFGTPQPLSGVSGMLRRSAFKYSESDLRHWMILLFADRVNMVKGLGSDLMRGHVPNIFAEMGGRRRSNTTAKQRCKRLWWCRRWPCSGFCCGNGRDTEAMFRIVRSSSWIGTH